MAQKASPARKASQPPPVSKGDSAIVLLGKWLESKYGVACSEHPAFGGVDPGHKPTSYHYKNEAVDVNHDQGDESKVLNEIYDLLSSKASELNVVELFYEERGIPGPEEDHFDHLHVAVPGPPTEALIKLVSGLGGGALSGVPDALGKGAEAVGGAAADAASGAAKVIVSALLDAIGADGARILLYIALVTGGAVLVYYGTARAVGIQRPIATPVGLAAMKGKA